MTDTIWNTGSMYSLHPFHPSSKPPPLVELFLGYRTLTNCGSFFSQYILCRLLNWSTSRKSVACESRPKMASANHDDGLEYRHDLHASHDQWSWFRSVSLLHRLV
jgi:hypothetical protein